jgi:hypothetical protein
VIGPHIHNNKVYKLERIYDVPRYEGFCEAENVSFLGNEDLDEDFLIAVVPPRRRDWKVPRLAKVWKPVKVIGRVRKFNDYPCIGSIPAFSQRAVDALRDLLEPNGELLPLISPLGSYYAYNVTTVADVLDLEHSEIHWGRKPIAFDIKRYVFRAEQLQMLSIFRIPEEPSGTYVTEVFASRVREHSLEGFNLIPAWPLPPGTRFIDMVKKARRSHKRMNLPKGQTVKGNSVVFRLRSASKRGRFTKEEKARIERLMDELDGILVDPDSRDQAPGNLEGHEYIGENECRWFVSCPDADALVKKLWTWLKSLRWKGKLLVMKRYGEYVDTSAREEYVDLAASQPRPLPPVERERALTREERRDFETHLAKGFELVKIGTGTGSDTIAKAVQAWIEDYLAKKKRPNSDPLDFAIALGCLWGETVCKTFDWEWKMVTLVTTDQETYAIVSPRRECLIFPIHNIDALLRRIEGKVNTPNTLTLYKRLKAGKLGSGVPKSYQIVD